MKGSDRTEPCAALQPAPSANARVHGFGTTHPHNSSCTELTACKITAPCTPTHQRMIPTHLPSQISRLIPYDVIWVLGQVM